MTPIQCVDVVGAVPNAALDAITQAAALACGTPIALIRLLDQDRQLLQASVGPQDLTEALGEIAFCAYTILGDGILEIENATQDKRFASDPLVRSAPCIRAYAGVPLIFSDGSKIGTLCVIDRLPRRLDECQRQILTRLALAAAQLLEQRYVSRMRDDTEHRLRESEEFLERTGRLAGVGGWALDLVTGTLTWTSETYRIHGLDLFYKPSLESAIEFYAPEARPVIEAAIAVSKQTGEGWDLELPLIRADGRCIWVRAVGTVTRRDGQPVRLVGAFQDITESVERSRALRDAQDRVTLATNGAQIGIWDWNLETGVKIWSPLMFQLYGVTSGELPATVEAWRARLHEDDRDRAAQALLDAIAGKQPYNIEFRVVWDDGSHHYLRGAAAVTFDDAGLPIRMVGASWDVTESRVLSEALANSNELLRVTLQSIGDGIITTDAAGRLSWMNPVAEQLTGWQSDAAVSQPLLSIFNILNGDTREPAQNPVDLCLAESRIAGLANHTILVSRQGVEYGIEDSAAPIRSKTGETLGAVLVFRDVTAQRRIASEMTYRATHDTMTGLLNRAEFEVRLRYLLDKSRADQKQSVLLFLDLDQFKLVNDTCGHAAGDLLIKEVARLLSELTRGSDAVARLGGDEFAILLDHCSVEHAVPVAQKICDRMEHFRFAHGGQRFRIGASIGLVPVDDRWSDITGIMRAADASCYAAKESGRNRVHIWSDTDLVIHARHHETQWATRLEQALDDDRFVLFVQRIYNLQPDLSVPNQGIHAEVLLRMVSHDDKLIRPASFLPAAERFHMISRIDRWVLDHVIHWMGAVPAIETIEMLAVNISGQSVSDAAFQNWVINRLVDAGPQIRSRLCLEITETAVVASLTDAAWFIEQVRRTGVRTALDDFGAGASSFGYLKSLQLDYLKIDGQFVRNVLHDPLNEAAVRSFVDVAGVVGLRTIAEFVDSNAVMTKVQEMGVNYAQGYLMHKPAPIDELLMPEDAHWKKIRETQSVSLGIGMQSEI